MVLCSDHSRLSLRFFPFISKLGPWGWSIFRYEPALNNTPGNPWEELPLSREIGNSGAEITVWLTPDAKGGNTERQELLRETWEGKSWRKWWGNVEKKCCQKWRSRSSGGNADLGWKVLWQTKGEGIFQMLNHHPSSRREHGQGCWKCNSLGWMEKLWRIGNKILDKQHLVTLQPAQSHPLQVACAAVTENENLLI